MISQKLKPYTGPPCTYFHLGKMEVKNFDSEVAAVLVPDEELETSFRKNNGTKLFHRTLLTNLGREPRPVF